MHGFPCFIVIWDGDKNTRFSAAKMNPKRYKNWKKKRLIIETNSKNKELMRL